MTTCVRCGREVQDPGYAANLCPECRVAVAGGGGQPAAVVAQPPIAAMRRVPYRPPFTVAIVGINVLVFALMVLSGVPLVTPNVPQIVRWGANFGPLSLGAQWWRILTSNYVHIGIIHLAVNMWSLWQVGRLAERIFGGWPYLLAYTATGIAGSLASLLWRPVGVSAGASGAIFGMVGALIGALYLGHLPLPKPAQQSLLKNLVVVAAVNLIYGAQASNIDNSAHIGGLIMGLAIGALLGPQLMQPREQRQAHERFVFLGVVLFLIGFGVVVKHERGPIVDEFRRQAPAAQQPDAP
jgi:membrane associated rhomboid family serine protease